MGAAFTILAFFTVLGLVVPFVSSASPFGATSTPPISNPLPASVYQKNAGCTTTTGLVSCNATVAAGGGGGIFGSIVSGTLLIFGNFFAAAQYLANLAIGMVLPYNYIYSWLNWSPSASSVAAAIAAMVNALVWVAYANEWMYILSGRWIFPP